jgi:hypothetical protein
MNSNNGDLIALIISITLFSCILYCFFYSANFNYKDGGFASTLDLFGYIGGGLVTIAVCFFVFNWLMLKIFMPGNKVYDPPAAKDVIKTVNASNATIFGLISLFLYKLCGKKKQEEKKEG